MIGMMVAILAGTAVQAQRPPPPPPPLVVLHSNRADYLKAIADIPVPAVRATSIQSLPTLFSTADYPAAAVRRGDEGTVSFSIAINRDGRVTHCAVTTSSGSPSLDSATCGIITRRARFEPARDEAGRTVEDRSVGRVRWVLPQAPPLPYADGRMAMIFTMDAAGAVTECRTEFEPLRSERGGRMR